MRDLPKGKPVLCLDFDGVIHSYSSGWKGPRNIPDPPVLGALSFLEMAREVFDLAIYSSRSRYFGGRWAMKRWLKKYLVDYYWDKYPNLCGFAEPMGEDDCYLRMANDLLRSIKFPTKKPAAFLQIDDRAICFTGTFPDLESIMKFKPWNKK